MAGVANYRFPIITNVQGIGSYSVHVLDVQYFVYHFKQPWTLYSISPQTFLILPKAFFNFHFHFTLIEGDRKSV